MAARRKGCEEGVFALEDGRCLVDASLSIDVRRQQHVEWIRMKHVNCMWMCGETKL